MIQAIGTTFETPPGQSRRVYISGWAGKLQPCRSAPSDTPPKGSLAQAQDGGAPLVDRPDPSSGLATAENDLTRNRIETSFDPVFASTQALREKQIQQNYRPIIGIHKWFARRPGTLFRSLLLSEFGREPVSEGFWKGHQEAGLIADPFMGGGTTLYEAARLGLSVVGNDINPMSAWLNRRAFDQLDIEQFEAAAESVLRSAQEELGDLYKTRCVTCDQQADVKYFLWVKQCNCPSCGKDFDVFPGHMLAENVRHPNYVVGCKSCGALNEYEALPTPDSPGTCQKCDSTVTAEGNFKRSKATCPHCATTSNFPSQAAEPPRHRLWAMEYRCQGCYHTVKGRQFKAPDHEDLRRVDEAERTHRQSPYRHLVPAEEIPAGDETDRLHRWGYSHYAQMFNDRQLLALTCLVEKIQRHPSRPIQDALLTVLSDILRYNNMLCRYDTYALKCQDIFSVHGFPVGVVQCENNPLGIPNVGSGGFRHFIEKYVRAKTYAKRPFETAVTGKKKQLLYPEGEAIEIQPNSSRTVAILCQPSQEVELQPGSLDGVFTDPPYFANVQYSELIDFCYVWLRTAARNEDGLLTPNSTRSAMEATGNTTAGRGIDGFASALSAVFVRFCGALKEGAPLVFTYHHNDALAYAPLVVAVLDSKLSCTAVFPAAAEMSASMHIANTSSSILDSVFVCRSVGGEAKLDERVCPGSPVDVMVKALVMDAQHMRAAGVRVSTGDLRCLLAGRVAAQAINRLRDQWDAAGEIQRKMQVVGACLRQLIEEVSFNATVEAALSDLSKLAAKGS